MVRNLYLMVIQSVDLILRTLFDEIAICCLDVLSFHVKMETTANFGHKIELKVLVVVVIESGKGVIRKRQYAQVRTTRIHLKLTHQIVKVHPLEESRVKVLQIFVHRLTLDLLQQLRHILTLARVPSFAPVERRLKAERFSRLLSSSWS